MHCQQMLASPTCQVSSSTRACAHERWSHMHRHVHMTFSARQGAFMQCAAEHYAAAISDSECLSLAADLRALRPK